ncbi:hypothetical protein H6F42_20265 [Pseudanabaena sp. FACHB-1998]|uniref:hypothetical protein n=1 Tax=Pseudanabaena sp. FACHB-1998 TaxID=2692858 RepID=UPI0016818919|nr:hypothetical protein [Pseudanabaena sp. FACHB-1998]
MSAQIPIDPLRRLQDVQGAYNYTLGITYTPSSSQGIDFDETGFPYRFNNFNQGTSLSLSGGYSFNEYFGINSVVDWSFSSTRENRDFLDFTRQTLNRSNSSVGGSFGLEYRAAPSSFFDPRFSVNVAYPWTISTQGQISLVRDPMILLGSIGYSRSLQGVGENVSIGIGTGFVANDVISLSGSANYSIPTDGVSLPVTSLSFRTGYNLDPKGNQEIGVRATLSTSGSDTRIGIGLEFGGRGVITAPSKDSATQATTSNASGVPLGTQQTGILPSQPTSSTATSSSTVPKNTTPSKLEEKLDNLSQNLATRELQLRDLQQQILEIKKELESLKK